MFIWANLNTDPLVIFLWKLAGSRERKKERKKNTRSNPEFGNEGLCAANFLIKERRTTSTVCSDSNSTSLTALRGSQGALQQDPTVECWEICGCPDGRM